MVLFDLESLCSWYDSWSLELSQCSRIAIPDGDIETKKCVLFGFAVTWFLAEVSNGYYLYFCETANNEFQLLFLLMCIIVRKTVLQNATLCSFILIAVHGCK